MKPERGTGAVSPLVLLTLVLEFKMMSFFSLDFYFEMYYYANKSTPVVAHYQCRQGSVLGIDIIHYWFLLNKLQIVIWVRPFI